MDLVEAIVNIVNNVGFPITVAGIMFWQMDEERKAHAQESAAWTDAVNRNTSVMERLLDKLNS